MMEEVKREGLASVLMIQCDKCGEKFYHSSSPKVKGSGKKKTRYAVNIGAVWGQMATGGGHSNFNETVAALDVPGMASNTFTNIEQQIGKAWEVHLAQEITKAGEEEREIAVSKKTFFEGIPAISVTVDGGWSKRSHKHSYNAKSGVAVIIGNATKKLLYMGVRNKYCSICTVASNKGTTPKEHNCFKNWDGSSSAMESDILVEGFRAAEVMHGLRYMHMIGDGDSSVLANIQTGVPGWGMYVTKIECANHSVKCYRNRLEKIVQDFPKYKGKGKLTQRAIKRLTNGARCAIKINSKDGKVSQLRSDLRNGPNHVFNDHRNCNPYFCKAVAPSTSNTTTSPPNSETTAQSAPPDSLMGTIDDIINDERVVIYSIEEEAREGDNTANKSDLPDDLYFRIQRAGDRLLSNAGSLITNSTSNLAECFMGIRCKFDGGKVFNRIQRGSFQHRCNGAGLRFQLGPDWASRAWQQVTGEQPGEVTSAFYDQQVLHHNNAMKRKAKDNYKEARKKARYM